MLKRASKSGTIAITGDDAFVAMVNPEDDSLSVFSAGDSATAASRSAKVQTGNEPSAVVIHPDDDTAFVANRAAATVVKITGLRGATPTVSATVDVGSEPTGLALSPTGAKLFVAEFAEGRVAVIDTASMQITGHIDEPEHPRAVAVTNNLDASDDDELVVVPEFFGEAIGAEATDESRRGRVRLYHVNNLSPEDSITFAPRDSGFAPDNAPQGTPTVKVSPNQLWSVAIIGSKIYVPSVSASPAGPTNFQTNVQPVAYVGNLDSPTEDTSPLGTNNLAQLVRDQTQQEPTRFFLADTVDVSFVGTTIAYYVARGADVVQRLDYEGPDAPVVGGTPFNKQIDLNVVPDGSQLRCQNPTGIVTRHTGGIAYVNCWVTRALGVIDFSTQSLGKTVESTVIGTSEVDVQAGRRFYFTGRARWSKNAWSDCGSCHPDGLSDNITWAFGTGPRQTTSMDGSFSHGAGAQKQRVFNWTGIFDEVHDFERNTRGVSGGLGAITTPAAQNGACGGDLSGEARVAIDPPPPASNNLSRPAKDFQDTTPGVCVKDWDKIDAFVKTIRPPRGLRFLDAASVARGATLFGEGAAANNAGCVRCHGDAGWTVSRRFYTPTEITNDTLHTAVFARPSTQFPAAWNNHNRQIQVEQSGAGIGPDQVACVLRNLGTFGDAALERRDNGNKAQGEFGYNVPSLYGGSLGAPYLHHGGAKTLQELFDDVKWKDHIVAGNPNWIAGRGDQAPQAKADLIAFLLSIDPTTPEQEVPTGFDACVDIP